MLEAQSIIDELFKRNGLRIDMSVDGLPVYTIPGRKEYVFVHSKDSFIKLGIFFKTGKKKGRNTEVKAKLTAIIDLHDPESIKAVCDWVKEYAGITLDLEK